MKKVLSLLLLVASVLLVILSVERVTLAGALIGLTAFDQTISFSGECFYLTLVDRASNSIDISFTWVYLILFSIGILLVCVANVLLIKDLKTRSISMLVVNTIGFALIIFNFCTLSYLIMLIIVSILLCLNVVILHITDHKQKINKIIFVISLLTEFANIFFLSNRFLIDVPYLEKETERKELASELTTISRINIICFAAWLIPIGLLIIRELKTRNKESESIQQNKKEVC